MKKLNIPFFSQLNKEVPQQLQRSVCTVACLKMILDYKKVPNTFADILKEIEIIGGREISNWNHETFVRLLRNHGILSYRQEFFGQTIDLHTLEVTHAEHCERFESEGLVKIKEQIKKGNPVIVSVFAGFSQDHSSKKSINMVNHVILITGFDDEYLYVNDPIFDTSTRVTFSHFMNYWRRLAIFVE
jgi:hypothetical protein